MWEGETIEFMLSPTTSLKINSVGGNGDGEKIRGPSAPHTPLGMTEGSEVEGNCGMSEDRKILTWGAQRGLCLRGFG